MVRGWCALLIVSWLVRIVVELRSTKYAPEGGWNPGGARERRHQKGLSLDPGWFCLRLAFRLRNVQALVHHLAIHRQATLGHELKLVHF